MTFITILLQYKEDLNLKNTLKLLALILALCLTLSLAACGKPAEKPAASAEADAAAVNSTAPDTAAPPAATEEDDGFEDVLVMDNEYVRIVLLRSFPVGTWNMVFDVENKTDKYLKLNWEDPAVFDCMVEAGIEERVNPGEHTELVGNISGYDLEYAGLRAPDQFSFRFQIYDRHDDSWSYDDDELLIDEPVVLYPTGLNAETAKPSEQPRNDNETVLADTDEFTVTFLYGAPDPSSYSHGYSYLMRFDNKSDRTMIFSGATVCINGEPFVFSENYTTQRPHPDELSVRPHTHRYYLCEIMGHAFEDLDYTNQEVREISFTLGATTENSEDLYLQPVTVTLQ